MQEGAAGKFHRRLSVLAKVHPITSCVRAARQAHCKSRAFARLARHRHVAAHHACELASDGKTKAGAAKSLRRRLA
jgi:hypothetical protein